MQPVAADGAAYTLVPPGEYEWTSRVQRCVALCQITLTICRELIQTGPDPPKDDLWDNGGRLLRKQTPFISASFHPKKSTGNKQRQIQHWHKFFILVCAVANVHRKISISAMVTILSPNRYFQFFYLALFSTVAQVPQMRTTTTTTTTTATTYHLFWGHSKRQPSLSSTPS